MTAFFKDSAKSDSVTPKGIELQANENASSAISIDLLIFSISPWSLKERTVSTIENFGIRSGLIPFKLEMMLCSVIYSLTATSLAEIAICLPSSPAKFKNSGNHFS